MHFQGPDPALDEIARAVLGVGIADIEKVFAKK
jgi:hypothetical protein